MRVFFVIVIAISLFELLGACDKNEIPPVEPNHQDSTNVIVNESDTIAPSAMTNISYTVSDESVDLSWVKSVSTDVYNYEINWSLGGVTHKGIVKAAENTYQAAGLINFETYSFEMFAMDSAGNKSTTVTFSAMPVTFDPNAPDLDICYIKRLPEIEYVENSLDPTREGWPIQGQEVIWRAYVKNWSPDTMFSVQCEWSIGDQVIHQTIDAIPPFQMGAAEVVDQWAFTRKNISLQVTPSSDITEVSTRNNSLTVFSDALSVHFYVEKGLYDYFHENQSNLGIGSNSWEDWAQRHISFMNELCEEAVYPVSPDGILDRFRLDSIVIVSDGELPLNGGLPSNNPDLLNKKCDLQWGFPRILLHENDNETNFYNNTSSATYGNPFYIEGSLWHELGHARYLIDGYGFDLSDNGSNILIEENGQPIAGTSYMPYQAWNVVYYHKYPGFMASPYEESSPYVAAAMNLIAGHRAVCGNMNAPCNIGAYIQDLPSENRLTIIDEATGEPCANADIKIYRATPDPEHWYGKTYDNIPDLEMTTDVNGQLLLGRCPFNANGKIVHTHGHANGLLILRIKHNGTVNYRFLESSEFNLEYWQGNTNMGNYTIYI